MTSETERPNATTPSARAMQAARRIGNLCDVGYELMTVFPWERLEEIAHLIDIEMAEPAVVPALREAMTQLAIRWREQATRMSAGDWAQVRANALRSDAEELDATVAAAMRLESAAPPRLPVESEAKWDRILNSPAPPSPQAPQGEPVMGTCKRTEDKYHQGPHRKHPVESVFACLYWTSSPPAPQEAGKK